MSQFLRSIYTIVKPAKDELPTKALFFHKFILTWSSKIFGGNLPFVLFYTLLAFIMFKIVILLSVNQYAYVEYVGTYIFKPNNTLPRCLFSRISGSKAMGHISLKMELRPLPNERSHRSTSSEEYLMKFLTFLIIRTNKVRDRVQNGEKRSFYERFICHMSIMNVFICFNFNYTIKLYWLILNSWDILLRN